MAILLIASMARATLPGGTTFEGNDGNLTPAGGIDWNSFVDAPGGQANITALGTASAYTALTDDTGNSDGSIFTKSTKNHEHECPNVGSGSMGGGGNKDDLARMYLATQSIDNNVFLYLAWVRVYPQNSTTAAANLSFEFNQSEETCAEAGYTGTRASDLVVRTAGDMLVLYDFAGGSTEQGSNNPQIRISRWITSGSCEVGSQTAPCWGPVATLNATQAEARVNDASIGPVFDNYANQAIGTVAFGEASINLTASGVFGVDGQGNPTTCASFGSALGISRSSGNSITSSLSDYIGPADFTISNCGSVTVRKATSPAEDPASTQFAFTNNLVRLPPGATDATIGPLVDGGSTTFTNVRPGTALQVSESDPSGANYALTDITCTSGSTATSIVTNATDDAVNGVPARTVQFNLAAGQSIDCTFTNTKLTGSVLVLKEDGDGTELAGAAFTIDPEGDNPIVMDRVAGYDGLFCTDGLPIGTQITVSETTTPAGYETAADQTYTPTTASDCDEKVAAFEDEQDPADPDLTFVNLPSPGQITILKTDDLGTVLSGAVFTLYNDDGDTAGSFDASDTSTGRTCTTGADGVCYEDPDGPNGEDPIAGFTDVALGLYCVVETTTPAGYSTADPQCGEVEFGATLDDRTLSFTFVNPRLHTVIVIVCHQGTDTLAASDVTDDADPANELTTLAAGATLPDGVSEADLCSLAGFDDLEHGDLDLTVDVGSDAHPAP